MQLTHVYSQKSSSTARPRSWRKLSGVEFSHTLPISGARTWPFSTLIGEGSFALSLTGDFQLFSHEVGAVLDEFLILRRECGREVTIDIEFPHHFAMSKDRHHDIGFSFERARQIARISGYIIDN